MDQNQKEIINKRTDDNSSSIKKQQKMNGVMKNLQKIIKYNQIQSENQQKRENDSKKKKIKEKNNMMNGSNHIKNIDSLLQSHRRQNMSPKQYFKKEEDNYTNRKLRSRNKILFNDLSNDNKMNKTQINNSDEQK